MKTITFKIPILVLALTFTFSYSLLAQYTTAEHYSHGADMAETYLNTQWNVHPSDVTSDGTFNANDNEKAFIGYKDIDNTYAGEESSKQVKTRYTIIPNPSSGKSKLEVQVRPKDSQLMLFDLTGRLQLKVSIDPGQDKAEIDVSSLHKSIYILKVLAGEAVVGVEKLVIN
jgi:hypothetical protein